MTTHSRILLLAALVSFPAAVACAQPPAPAANPPAGAAGEGAVPPPPPPPIADPAVLAIQATNPTSPSQLVRATGILIDLRHPEVAHPYVRQLVAANLAEADLAALGREFGSAAFLKIALEDALQPEGEQFAAAVRAALARYAVDPARLAAEIAKLADPSIDVRRRAVFQLRLGGTASVQALIAVLADPSRAAEHEAVRTALVAQGEAAFGPTLAMLQANEPAVHLHAYDVLGRLQMPEALPLLLGPALSQFPRPEARAAATAAVKRMIGEVPSQRDAALTVHREARAYYDGLRTLDRDGDGLVEVWRWDAATNAPVADALSELQARIGRAYRLSIGLSEIVPESRTANLLLMSTRLEQEVLRYPPSEPLPTGHGSAHSIAAVMGPQFLYDLLADSLAHGRHRAAAAAARVLGGIGDAELLYVNSPEPSALVEAARSPDRRLRFAAVEAIQRLHPAREYPGAHHVLDSLAFFAAAGGIPRVLVADASLPAGQTVAGLLMQRGYDVELVSDARSLLRTAAASPDFELALVDLELPSWPLDQVLQQIRRNGRSAALPLGIVPPPGGERDAEDLARGDARSVVVIRPTDVPSLDLALGRVLTAGGGEITAPEERRAQALLALQWLGELAAEEDGFHDLSRAEPAVLGALQNPDLSLAAAGVLVRSGTPAAQRALLDLASTNALPLQVREKAAEAFRDSVAARGTLLTTVEIERQYDRYNASENLDADTQRVLGFVLDVVEAARRN